MDNSVAATHPNFDQVGSNATLFLVAQACVNAAGSASGGVSCSPFDDQGLLVRNIIRLPVTFSV